MTSCSDIHNMVDGRYISKRYISTPIEYGNTRLEVIMRRNGWVGAAICRTAVPAPLLQHSVQHLSLLGRA